MNILVAPVQVRMTPGERRAWRAAARRRKTTISDFVRAAVRRELTADAQAVAEPEAPAPDAA